MSSPTGRSETTRSQDSAHSSSQYATGAATEEVTTRTVVEGVRRDVQAQIDQNRSDTLRRADETRRKVDKVLNELKELTTQLNAFKPVSAQTVGEEQKVLSEKFQQ